MKEMKIYLTMFMAISFLTFANAQDTKDSLTFDQRQVLFEEALTQANEQAGQMKEALNLTEEQARELASLNYFYGRELKEACSVMDAENVATKYDRIQYARENAIKEILSEEQYEAYSNLRDDNEWVTLDPYKFSDEEELQDFPVSEEELTTAGFQVACFTEEMEGYDMSMNYGNHPNVTPSVGRNLINGDGSPIDSEPKISEAEKPINIRQRKKSYTSKMPKEGFDNKGYAKAMRKK
ncbi:MAG: hypothetical protein ACK4ND_18355 [Cytophagaceae bacterium]